MSSAEARTSLQLFGSPSVKALTKSSTGAGRGGMHMHSSQHQRRASAGSGSRALSCVPAYLAFPRQAVETIAGGDDPLRGTRHDRALGAGQAHPLGDVRILSYQRNAAIEALGLPRLARGEHMKVPASDLKALGLD